MMDRQPITPGFKIGPVTCGLCGTPVDRVVFYVQLDLNMLAMVAHCHGARDERLIPNDPGSLEDAVKLQRAIEEGGVAFDQTKLISNGEDHAQRQVPDHKSDEENER